MSKTSNGIHWTYGSFYGQRSYHSKCRRISIFPASSRGYYVELVDKDNAGPPLDIYRPNLLLAKKAAGRIIALLDTLESESNKYRG